VNTELLAVAGEENGGYTDLVYGTLESQRMMHVTTTQAIASPFLLINNPKHIQIYKLENGTEYGLVVSIWGYQCF